MAKNRPIFPPPRGWISNEAHQFIPVNMPAERMRLLINSFLRGDRQFAHALRSCEDRWYCAVWLGRKTMSIHILNYADVHAQNKTIQTSRMGPNMDDVYLFTVDRHFQQHAVTDQETFDKARMTHPILYVSRALTREECWQVEDACAEYDNRPRFEPEPMEEIILDHGDFPLDDPAPPPED